MPAISPRSRWTLSFLVILVLFGANCGLYLWGNAQRTQSLFELKSALENKDLLLEFRSTLDNRQREFEILEPLLRSGAASTDSSRLAAYEVKVRPLDELADTLATNPDSRDDSAQFLEAYERLKLAWLELVAGRTPDGTPGSDSSISFRAEFERTLHEFDGLFRLAGARVAFAEATFAGVASLTDRMTWAIFTLSLLLTTGIIAAAVFFLRTTLGRYLSPQIASNLLENPGRLKMGGQRIRITVLMADLRGFSGLAERLPPETVVKMINNYLEVMTGVILDYGGTIDEFIGDAILVFFGAPEPRSDHARVAVACAVQMQLAMAEVHRRSKALGLPEVEMGIGINTGVAVVGNVGCERRAKYGAVGRHVNLASRIQSTAVGGQIMISERTALEAGWDLKIRDGVKISPKGFSKPVGLLDIKGIGGEYGLELPDADPEMKTLPEPLPAEISLMTQAGPVATWTGEISALSLEQAELQSDRPVPLLAGLSIRLTDPAGGGPGPEIYGKVVNAGGATGRGLVVRFTSRSPEAVKILERLST